MPGSAVALKRMALGWLLLVALVIVLALRQGLVFDSSILKLLPASDQQPLVQLASEQLGEDFSSRLLLLLSGEDEDRLQLAVDDMATSLLAEKDFSAVYWRVSAQEMQRQREASFPFRFSLLDDNTRKLLLAEDYETLSQRALQRLYAPVSAAAGSIIEDPFALYLEQQLNRSGSLSVQLSNSLLKLNNAASPTYLIVLTLNGSPFSAQLQERVIAAINRQQTRLAADIDSLRMSGMLLHAIAGAGQARSEMSTIGTGSMLGIVVVMLLVFGRAKSFFLVLFPVAVGCAFASAMVMLVFGSVHLLTFAFGAGLVGVSIDYALHFLCERRVTAVQQVLPRILPGLLLGLVSSLMAYAAMALTPFPGLRQMAVFSVAGLSASWLTVVLWFPLLTRKDNIEALASAHSLDLLRKRFPRLEKSRMVQCLLLLPVVLSIAVIANGSNEDDIRLLQTSPQSLIEQDQEIGRALGSNAGSRYLLVSGDTLQACLQKEEQLIPELEAMREESLIGGFQALSSQLPSLQRQSENSALIAALYDNQLQAFYGVLQLPANKLNTARDIFAQTAGKRLDQASWQSGVAPGQGQRFIVGQAQSSPATIIRFSGQFETAATQRLQNLADSMDGVVYVDRIEDISYLMAQYREQISVWVVLAYCLLLFVLMLRYRSQLWRIVLPPLLASIFTLAILLQLEQGINLFHMMALILVLGIGLDMGIFLSETDDATHTWLAVSLSLFTSLLAFGLLALSETPVLHHFGITVAIGLSLVWFLAPLMRSR